MPTSLASPEQGAKLTSTGVEYCVWAPGRQRVEAMIEAREGRSAQTIRLEPQPGGFFQAGDPQGRAGDRYRFRLDGDGPFPDMFSRWQPEGVFGPSMVIDPATYAWQSGEWMRPSLDDLIFYELHIGTFTAEGTFRSAIDRLDAVSDLGVNAIELMPVADFPGRWNWGYDGVMLYAPSRAYGSPDDLRALVDAAHQRGIAVVLDVVYNHLGPSGNFLGAYTPRYFHAERHTPWGQAFNLDGEDALPVRDFFLRNVAYWLDEYRIDGLRLDATHAIEDASPRHLISEAVALGQQRGACMIAEDERNQATLFARPEDGGWGLDAAWADDFHHSARVAATGQREAYFAGFSGTASELVDILQHGWSYRGRPTPKGHLRGTPCQHLPPQAFVFCVSNHDQVGNRPFGDRLHEAAGLEKTRAAVGLLLLGPYTPLLFMGQEWAASTPFQFFTDHEGELGEAVSKGRAEEFAGFTAFGDPAAIEKIPDPQAEATFQRSILNWSERSQEPHAAMLAWHLACIKWRRRLAAYGRAHQGWHAALAGEAVGLRWSAVADQPDRLLLCSLREGSKVGGAVAVPPPGARWREVLSSFDPRFGGRSEAVIDWERGIGNLGAPGAMLLEATP
jgi:maltooligosyltrehalose trehalohydrolase